MSIRGDAARSGVSVLAEAGAAAAVRRQAPPIRARRRDVLDVAGSGGDGSGTSDISAGAALVSID